METLQIIVDSILFLLIVIILVRHRSLIRELEQSKVSHAHYNHEKHIQETVEQAMGNRFKEMEKEIAYLKYPARYQLKDKVEITFRLVTGSFNGIIIARRDNYTRATYNYPASVAWIYEVYNPITEQTHDIPQEQIIQVLPKETKIC